MQPAIFKSIKEIVYERSGIDLKEGKAKMVSARIAKRLRDLQLEDDKAYLAFLKEDADEIVQLLNVISTNVTRFFREKAHFSFTESVVTQWLGEGQDKLRIWSAASSTGQEPYSLLMTIAEVIRKSRASCDFRLLGTDISTKVLDKAESGYYDAQEVDGIASDLLKRYFAKQDGGYQVRDSLRSHALFRRMNLNEPPFPMKGPMDMVFCCNVMIYFDTDTKRRLLTDVHRLLRPDGYLIVSHTESLAGMSDLYRPVQPSIYVKADAPPNLGKPGKASA
ncbi:MAG: protein-glutamate O-methyltransferase CheR [Phycisphaeraceae bacterium]|nr:protein-glutamate O-methyltransferase CheR [Phycisphaeraceae bacterium]